MAKDVRRWNPLRPALTPQSTDQHFIRTREQLLRHSRGDWTEDDDY